MLVQPAMSGHFPHAPQRSAIQLRRRLSRDLSDIAIERNSERVRRRQDEVSTVIGGALVGKANTFALSSREVSRPPTVSGWSAAVLVVSPASHSRVTSNSYASNFIVSPVGARRVPHQRAALSSAIKRRTHTTATRVDLVNSRALREVGENVTKRCRPSWAAVKPSSASMNLVRTDGANAAAIAQVTMPSASQIGSGLGIPFSLTILLHHFTTRSAAARTAAKGPARCVASAVLNNLNHVAIQRRSTSAVTRKAREQFQ